MRFRRDGGGLSGTHDGCLDSETVECLFVHLATLFRIVGHEEDVFPYTPGDQRELVWSVG